MLLVTGVSDSSAARTRNRSIQGVAVKRMFDNPAFLARIPGQGLHCINTATVTAFELYPGSPEVPKDTWLANLQHGSP